MEKRIEEQDFIFFKVKYKKSLSMANYGFLKYLTTLPYCFKNGLNKNIIT